jgi:hypothetical protein
MPKHVRPVLLTFCLLFVLAPAAAAQTVRGTLLHDVTDAPAAGALITLLDAAGQSQARTLTDADGRFELTARRAGDYVLRVERIGFALTERPVYGLAAGEARDLTVRAATSPIHLEGLVAVGKRRRQCAQRPEAGSEAAALWEEARKALSAAAVTEQQRGLLYEHARYETELHPRTLDIAGEHHRHTGRARRPFHSLPLEQLLADGFVQQTDSGTVYYSPDAEVLLSDEFLDSHCFRVVEPGDDMSGVLIGLSFEPAQRRAPGIRGTLWLNRHTAELRFVEFEYPSPAPGIPSTNLGGRVEFMSLPSGEWIVRRWWIRTPRLALQQVRTATGQPIERHALTGIVEHGGEVLAVLTRTGRPLYRGDELAPPPTPVVRAPATPDPAGAAAAATPPAPRSAAPSARAGRPRADVITRDEIERSTAGDVYTLVQSLRPQWLRARTVTSTLTRTTVDARGEEFDELAAVPVLVYFDDMRAGDPAALRGVSTTLVQELRYLNPREATQRLGTGHGNGAILVRFVR